MTDKKVILDDEELDKVSGGANGVISDPILNDKNLNRHVEIYYHTGPFGAFTRSYGGTVKEVRTNARGVKYHYVLMDYDTNYSGWYDLQEIDGFDVFESLEPGERSNMPS